MKTVAFYMMSYASHLYPTFALAKSFLSQGARVIYIVNENGAKIVEKEGLEVVLEGALTLDSEKKAHTQEPKFYPRRVWKNLHSFATHIDAFISKAKHVLNEQNVDVLFVDMIMDLGQFAGLGTKVHVYHLAVFNYPLLGDSVPPPSSSLVPASGIGYRLRLWQAWFSVALETYGLRRARSFVETGRRSFLKMLVIHVKLGIESRRYGHRLRLGWYGPALNRQQVVLGPRELDFAPASLGTYLGFCIDHTRDQAKLSRRLPSRKKTLFCSFGTQVVRYNREALRRAYDSLVRIFRKREELHLLLQASKDFRDVNAPPNITYMGHFSSLEIVNRVDAAVIHGGYGILKECVNAGVPMVVVPFRFDQPGNAARVEHLGIGKACWLDELDDKKLENAIDAVLDPQMRTRIQGLAERIRRNDQVAPFAAVTLERCLTRN